MFSNIEKILNCSLFVPKNQTEETLLLLLIAESMVSTSCPSVVKYDKDAILFLPTVVKMNNLPTKGVHLLITHINIEEYFKSTTKYCSSEFVHFGSKVDDW